MDDRYTVRSYDLMQVWRVAFAFDPLRRVILLVAGDKSGVSQQRFYKQLIKTAERRFSNHLNRLQE